MLTHSLHSGEKLLGRVFDMRIKREQATRCELALMGKVVPCTSDEVQVMTEYIMSAMGKDTTKLVDLMNTTIRRYNKANEVTHIVCNTVMDMPCITYLIDAHDGETPAPFVEDYGTGHPCAFCFVFNTESDWFSEFGDCFFEKREDGFYHRVS